MISIIIPTYNSATTISRCLDSIISQTYRDYEVLVIDGRSTDETIKIVKSHQSERITISSEPDKGIYDAMNKGIRAAQGEWLYFLGSDDYLYAPDVLEKVSKELTSKYQIVYGDVDSTHLSHEYKGEWKPSMIEYNRCHQAIFYHYSVFQKYGLYNTDYSVLADYIYNINCFWKYRLLTKYIPLIIAHYSEGGVSGYKTDTQFEKDIYLLLLRVGRGKLTINQRKEFARRAILTTDSRWLKFRLIIYVYYLRIIAKAKP